MSYHLGPVHTSIAFICSTICEMGAGQHRIVEIVFEIVVLRDANQNNYIIMGSRLLFAQGKFK